MNLKFHISADNGCLGADYRVVPAKRLGSYEIPTNFFGFLRVVLTLLSGWLAFSHRIMILYTEGQLQSEALKFLLLWLVTVNRLHVLTSKHAVLTDWLFCLLASKLDIFT